MTDPKEMDLLYNDDLECDDEDQPIEEKDDDIFEEDGEEGVAYLGDDSEESNEPDPPEDENQWKQRGRWRS